MSFKTDYNLAWGSWDKDTTYQSFLSHSNKISSLLSFEHLVCSASLLELVFYIFLLLYVAAMVAMALWMTGDTEVVGAWEVPDTVLLLVASAENHSVPGGGSLVPSVFPRKKPIFTSHLDPVHD